MIQDVLEENQLVIFLRNLKDFEQTFIDMVVSEKDFTLRLEVRGDKGKLVHCRVSKDSFDKPVNRKLK